MLADEIDGHPEIVRLLLYIGQDRLLGDGGEWGHTTFFARPGDGMDLGSTPLWGVDLPGAGKKRDGLAKSSLASLRKY